MRCSIRSTAAAAIALALAATVLFAPAPARAQDDSLARLLQRFGHEYDRQGLEPDVVLSDAGSFARGAVRCATRPVGDMERELVGLAVDEFLATTGSQHRSRQIEIPVAVHVLQKSNGAWNVTDAQIADQIDVLNSSYAAHGFSFTLASVDRYKKTRFAKRCLSENVERKFKKRYAVDPAATLNIYTCRPKQDVLGFAYFPSDFPESSFMHGVVLHHGSLPGGGAAPYDLGDTAVHEVGHYLGLFHTFEGRCTGKGDRIADTPAEKKPASGCPVDRDTCPSPGTDPVRNFMDYSDDSCVEEFTAEQARRMKDQVAAFKPTL